MALLQESNHRYTADARGIASLSSQARRHELVAGHAIILDIPGSSGNDLRPKVGDLFVTRVAGNVVAASQVASIDYVAELFGTRFVVAMVHFSFGAIVATLAELERATRAVRRTWVPLSTVFGRPPTR